MCWKHNPQCCRAERDGTETSVTSLSNRQFDWVVGASLTLKTDHSLRGRHRYKSFAFRHSLLSLSLRPHIGFSSFSLSPCLSAFCHVRIQCPPFPKDTVLKPPSWQQEAASPAIDSLILDFSVSRTVRIFYISVLHKPFFLWHFL